MSGAAERDIAEDGLPVPQRYYAVMTLVVGLSLSVLDTAIANIALPLIAKDLNASPANSIWVINAYQLAVVVSLMPLASLGDIFGYRRIYRIGLCVFAAASLACALSHSLLVLALARMLQGFGASGLMSVNSALFRFSYPRKRLGAAVGLIALTVAVSAALGPTVAAAILAVAPWPYLFAINVPFTLVALVLALRFLPYNEPSGQRFDIASAVLSALTFGLLIVAIDSAGHGEGGRNVVLALAGSIGFGVLLVRRQIAVPMPLLPVDLFRIPIFTLSVLTSLCSFVAQGIAFVAIPFYLQDALGRTAVESGLLMTPWPVTVAIVAPIAGWLADRHPAGTLGGVGLSVLTVGFVLLATLSAQPTSFDIMWRMVVCGFGFGLFQSPNNRALIASAPRERSGGAGAIQGTTRLMGQTIGAALVALVFGIAVHGAKAAIVIAAVFSGLAVLASISRLTRLVRFARPAAGSHKPAE